MGASVALATLPSPRANAEKPLKVTLRKQESETPAHAMADIGQCLDAARVALGWSLDRLALELGRDARQVSRWLKGEEYTQVALVWSVVALREPFVTALARLAGAAVNTEIRFGRSA